MFKYMRVGQMGILFENDSHLAYIATERYSGARDTSKSPLILVVFEEEPVLTISVNNEWICVKVTCASYNPPKPISFDLSIDSEDRSGFPSG